MAKLEAFENHHFYYTRKRVFLCNTYYVFIECKIYFGCLDSAQTSLFTSRVAARSSRGFRCCSCWEDDFLGNFRCCSCWGDDFLFLCLQIEIFLVGKTIFNFYQPRSSWSCRTVGKKEELMDFYMELHYWYCFELFCKA